MEERKSEMRWRNRKGSENVEDRRGESGTRRRVRFPFPSGRGGRGLPGGGIRLPTGRGGGIGIVGFLVILGLMFFLGVDPRVILGGGDGQPVSVDESPRPSTAEETELTKFVAVVLKTTEEFWSQQFQASGRQYREPILVLFREGTHSRCGTGVSEMGPFYCPLDQKVYIDLSFFEALKRRFSAPGDFAQAYVLAHEVGHHVQTLLGVTEQVMAARSRGSEREGNAIQMRMELQADCFAGLWANYAQRQLQAVEPGDIDEALNAAAAIGDDRIQKRSQGHVAPDSFTHGSSEQRVTWFRRGFESGSFEACDTFARGS
jgi:predicted metalloprotease